MTGWTVPGYTETSTLGSGATGRVVAAVEDATGVPVAIKYLSAKFLDDEAFLERFRAEAELLAGLEHPNVVRFYRYVEAVEAPAVEAPAGDGAEAVAGAEASGDGDGEATIAIEATDSAEPTSDAQAASEIEPAEPAEPTGDGEATVVIEPTDSAESAGDGEATEVLDSAAAEPDGASEPTAVIAAAEPTSSSAAVTVAIATESAEPDAAAEPVEATQLLAADGADSAGSHRPIAGAALIMELLEGATLRRVLKTSGPISPVAALSVMRGSLLGLDAAHGVGIVHRDYKPANVLLTTEGVSKLADFGIAEKAGAEMPAIGTPSYMAPEQWEGAPAEPVTDIYAVTASFYECLTGHVPYSAETVFELEELHRTAPIPLADVPPAVRGLVAHGLAKDAGLRPADVRTFIAELEDAAVAEYGVEWEEEGRRDLAVFVWPLSSGSAGGGGPEAAGGIEAGPGSGNNWFDGMYGTPDAPEAYEEDPGSTWKRVGRGTKAGLAAALIAVIGSTLAAVAFGSDSTAKAPVAGSTGITVPASSASLSETPSSTAEAGVNTTTPGTPTPTTSSKTSTTKPTPTFRTRTTSSPSLVVLPPTVSTSSPSPTEPTTSSSAPTSSAPTTRITTPTTSPSQTLTIVARLARVSTQSCPPSEPPSFQVTFVVSGLPSGSTVPISYSWRLLKNGGGGKGSVNGFSGTNFAGFNTRAVEDSVVVNWSTQDGLSGSTNSVLTCQIIG